MFFRFGSALSLVVLIALTGTSLEKQNLELKRAISQQHYRLDASTDSHVRLRLEAERLGTPARLLGPLDRGELLSKPPERTEGTSERRTPLLNWNYFEKKRRP